MAIFVFDAENFEEEVLQSDIPVLVDFWAEWCGYCHVLSPVVEQVAAEITDIKVGKINFDENQQLAARYNILGLPTLVLFENGHEIKRLPGAVQKSSILEMIGH